MSRPFRFGLVSAYAPSRQVWADTARRAEDLGYSTLLIPDRTTAGIIAPVPALTMAAAVTSSLRVGTYVFCNGYRHPVLLAREIAALDLLSDGRFEPGIGAGVSSQEFEQMGIAFDSPGARVERLAETIQLLKLLLTEESVTFNGKYYTVKDLKGNNKPLQKPHLPLMVAGAGERMLKLAAREADIIAIGSRGSDPSGPTLEQKIAWIKEAAGQRFADLELSQTIYGLDITDSPAPFQQMGGWPVPRIPMSTEQAIEHLLEQRERYGFSYLHVSSGQVENFAPVMARLLQQG